MSMSKKSAWACAPLLFLLADISLALDSYRYLHVSIETPWRIFLFLLIGILAPFVIMIWLYWRHATRSHHNDDTKQ